MKSLLLSITSIIFISSSYSQEGEIKVLGDKKDKKAVTCRDERFRMVSDCANTVYYEEGADAVFHKKSGKPYTGECKSCWGNGNLEMNIHFVNGKADGQDTIYYEVGGINLIRSHYQGKEDGTWMFYREDGSLKWEKNWMAGEASGKHIFYYPDGTIYKIEEWSLGQLTGVKKEFYKGKNGEEGKIKKEINYKDGKFHGLYITYFKNGQVESEQLFNSDQKDGLSKYYYDDGKLFYTENYNKGKKNGEIKRLYKNGNTWIIERYKNDERTGVWEEYYSEGTIKYEGTYKKGTLKQEQYYDEDGEVMASPERK
jgi:antitoxin component YwqK of YwqJK toxin-antitoxin module